METCSQCGGECRYRTITLDLGPLGGRHVFCSDSHEREWMKNQLASKIRTLNSIRCRSSGLARDLARMELSQTKS